MRAGDPPPPEGWPVYLGQYETMTQAVREHAATILELRGWCQEEWGNLEDNIGPFCVFGALVVARRSLGASALAEDLCSDQLVGELHLWIPAGPGADRDRRREALMREALMTWNDEPGRTVGDVVAALRGDARRGWR